MSDLPGILLWSTLLLQSVPVTDLAGRPFDPFRPGDAPHVLVFVSSDCPISNGYAPDVQRLCAEYGSKGVRCSLVYEDVGIEAGAVREHLDEYAYKGVSAVIDRKHVLAQRAKASVTPETVLIDAAGVVRYRGRIDNRYIDFGKPRRVVTVRDLRTALDAVLAGKPVATPRTTAVGCYIAGVK